MTDSLLTSPTVEIPFSLNCPLVSIGLPVFNGGRFIREALESVISQSYQNFEVIVSDNFSNDMTQEICEEYVAKDQRIRYIRQKENIGALNNFKYVVGEATGHYFAWLAHDDLLETEFIATCVDHLRVYKDCVLVSGEFKTMDESGLVIGATNMKNISFDLPWRSRAHEFFIYPISEAFFCIYGLARRSVLSEVLNSVKYGPLLAGSELPILSRMAVRGHVDSVPHVLRAYRFHAGSAYHTEQSNLGALPIRGRSLQYYNLWWNRFDQIVVLLGAKISFLLKVEIFNKVVRFYAKRLIWIVKKIPGFLKRKMRF